MDDDKATRFISSLVKSIQALCNGFVDFSTSIEVIGHIHLNIDRSVKLNYVLTEEVSKSVSEGSTVFSSHSYHSQAPPSVASKSANDSSNTSQKSRKDNDPLGLSALPREVPNTSKSDSHSHSSNRVNESSNSSHSFSRTSDETVKQENNRSSCQQEDSANRRRKVGPISQRTPSPAAKRVRTNDYSLGAKTMVKEQSYEVIEIKEEPDDEPSVFFGNSGSGQDIQTPDFTNVVMESLDRVNQIEGSELGDGSGGDGMGGPQQPVFPVMFHQNEGMSGGPIPGPSSDPQSVASTSGDAPQASGPEADDKTLIPSEDATPSLPPMVSPSTPTPVSSSSTPPIVPTSTPTLTPMASPTATPPSLTIATTTTTTTSPTSPTSATPPAGTALSVPSVASNLPPRPHFSIPPLSPKFKPEDLPADSKAEDVARLTERHVLERVPPTEKKKYPSKRCKVCLRRSGYTPGPARKHPKESVYYCPQCPSRPGLCCYPCYYVYHSKLNFWEPDESESEAAGRSGGRAVKYLDEGSSGYGGPGTSGLGRGEKEYLGLGVGFGGSLGSLGASSQASSIIGQAMQMGSGALYGGGVIDVEEEQQQEQKFCPVPMYGESLYGPGGQ